ncbi:MAG: ABC transporter substrate-binding protein, partial [Planctomycetota bacterium]
MKFDSKCASALGHFAWIKAFDLCVLGHFVRRGDALQDLDATVAKQASHAAANGSRAQLGDTRALECQLADLAVHDHHFKDCLAPAVASALAIRATDCLHDLPDGFFGSDVNKLEELWIGRIVKRLAHRTQNAPEALREKPNVGYLRALSAEGLLAQQPDLIIAAEGAGPPAVLAQLREAGLRVETVAEPPSPEGVLDKIATVGRLAGLEREAEALEAEVRARCVARQRMEAAL